MSVDYPQAIDMIISDPAWVFTDALLGVRNEDLTLVIHKTASPGVTDARAIAQFFRDDVTERKSVHFVVGYDGTVVQVVQLKDGAGGNCCLETGHDSYWDTLNTRYTWNGHPNLNTCTISIEHTDNTPDNSQNMSISQIDASCQLIAWLVKRYTLNPLTQIKGHNTLDPISRARCPGNTYPWDTLYTYLNIHERSQFMEQAMLDTWNMYFHNLSQQVGRVLTPPPYTTGIASDWKAWYPHKNFGSPMMYEQSSVNWSGDSIQVQLFTGGIRAEWNNRTNGPTIFYDAQGQVIQ